MCGGRGRAYFQFVPLFIIHWQKKNKRNNEALGQMFPVGWGIFSVGKIEGVQLVGSSDTSSKSFRLALEAGRSVTWPIRHQQSGSQAGRRRMMMTMTLLYISFQNQDNLHVYWNPLRDMMYINIYFYFGAEFTSLCHISVDSVWESCVKCNHCNHHGAKSLFCIIGVV